MDNMATTPGEDLAFYRSKADPEANELSTPPADECVRVPCVWVFEAFPPVFLSNLRLASENIDSSQNTRVLNPNFHDSVTRMRSRFYGGG